MPIFKALVTLNLNVSIDFLFMELCMCNTYYLLDSIQSWLHRKMLQSISTVSNPIHCNIENNIPRKSCNNVLAFFFENVVNLKSSTTVILNVWEGAFNVKILDFSRYIYILISNIYEIVAWADLTMAPSIY